MSFAALVREWNAQEWIGQAMGLLSGILTVIVYLLPRRRQMLAVAAAANFAAGLSFLLLGSGSASVICFVAVAQTTVNCLHDLRGSRIAWWELLLFSLLYLAGGALQYRSLPDLLPLGAAVFFMAAMSQSREQRIRWFSCGNAVLWIVYDVIVASSALLSHLVTLAALLLALLRGEKGKKARKQEETK